VLTLAAALSLVDDPVSAHDDPLTACWAQRPFQCLSAGSNESPILAG